MDDHAWFEGDPGEPLGLWWREEPPALEWPDLRRVRFEYTSRGERVPGRLWLPAGGGPPCPLVVLEHGATGAKDAPYIAQIGAPWVRGGAALLSIDLPLHGERTNPKLGAALLAGLGLAGRPTPTARAVVEDFVRQAVVDLERAVDAAAQLPGVDASRTVYAGLSLGAIVGATYCAVDPRPRAAALALAGGGFGGPRVDPVKHVARIAPRPILFVNMTGDEVVSRAASEALHAAAREPKQVVWFEGRHRELPGRGVKAMWTFLRRHLEGPAEPGPRP
jgi:dienelactone hydrolase